MKIITVTVVFLFLSVFGYGQEVKVQLTKLAIENALNAGGASGKLSICKIFDPYYSNVDVDGNKLELRRLSIAFNTTSMEFNSVDDSSYTLTLISADIYPLGTATSGNFTIDLAPHFISNIVISGTVKVLEKDQKSGITTLLYSKS